MADFTESATVLVRGRFKNIKRHNLVMVTDLKEFKDMGGAESKTRIILFSISPYVSLGELERYIDKVNPKVVALADFKDPKFVPMLKVGNPTVEEYLQWHSKFSKPEYNKEVYELFKGLARREIRVEQLDPSEEPAIELEGKKSGKKGPGTLETDLRAEIFEVIHTAKLNGKSMRAGLERRSEEIAEKIKSGEWHGNILVDEKGELVKAMELLLRNQLTGTQDVSIESAAPLKGSLGRFIDEAFGKGKVYAPITELLNLYIYGKNPSPERAACRRTLAYLYQHSPHWEGRGGSENGE
jgi:hypothetical protein